MSVAPAQISPPADRAWEGVFPLPLTPMEAFLLADTRPGYPMMNDIELEFRGTLDRDIFEAALRTALARNPLFCCLIVRDAKGASVWLPTDQTPEIDWAAEGTPLGDSYDVVRDLSRQIGLAIWVRQGADRATVLLHNHHVCSDALGTFAFIEDLLAGYASLCPEGPAVALRPLDPSRLLRRGLASIPKRLWYQQIFDLLFGAREAWKFFIESPAPLASPGAQAQADRPQMLTKALGPELTGQLRRVASASGATVNDLLLCDMFATLARWNRDPARSDRRGRVRILMPQNLREPADVATPTANIMSFAFLTRRADQCVDPAQLLSSLRLETGAIRRGRLSAYFLGSVGMALAAGMLDKLLASRICFSTVVLSNFGTPERRFVARFPRCEAGLVVGNIVFVGLRGAPPTRPGTRAAFSVVTSADNLTFTVKCDPAHLGPVDAARLLSEYVSQVAATARRKLAVTPAC